MGKGKLVFQSSIVHHKDKAYQHARKGAIEPLRIPKVIGNSFYKFLQWLI